MAKAPAFPLYVRDWLTATERLSLAAQGAWMRMCCHLHLADPRGELTLPLGGWARVMGCGKQRATRVLEELVTRGVSHVTFGDNGVNVACRRMLRERNARETSRLTTARWRQKREGEPKVTPPSSSASSSSSSTAQQKQPSSPAGDKFSAGFEKWWAAYPKGQRKRGKPKCWAKWKREKLEDRTEDILACLEAAKRSHDWKRDGGQYIQGPHPWLNSAPWLTEDFAKDAADGGPSVVAPPKMREPTKEDIWRRLPDMERKAHTEHARATLAKRPVPSIIRSGKWPEGTIKAEAIKLWWQGRVRAGGGKEKT